jgi:hypothetical protein
VLIVGSASSPFVYQVRPGSTTAEKFVDASDEGPGTFFFGMLADAEWALDRWPAPTGRSAGRAEALAPHLNCSSASRW